MDYRALKTSQFYTCCRARKLRFLCIWIRIRLHESSATEACRSSLENTYRKLFSSNHMLFMVEYWESDFISYGNQGQYGGFLCSEYDRPWKVVSQCPLNPCRGYCGSQRKGKIIKIKMNLLFLHLFLLLKDKSHFIFLVYSCKGDREHKLYLISYWLYGIQTKGTLLSNYLKLLISLHYPLVYRS